MNRGGLTSQSEPDPSTSQNVGRAAQYAAGGASSSNIVIGSNTGDAAVSQKHGKTHRSNPRKARELGDKVLEPFNLFGKDVGLQTRIHIYNASYWSRYPGYQGARFLPRDNVVQIVSEGTVRKVLTKCDKYKKYPQMRPLRDSTADIERDVTSICDAPDGKSYRKLFIILVLLKKASVVAWFIHRGICDDNLPLLHDPETDTLKWTGMRSSDHQFPTGGLKPSFFVKFMEQQWLVLVPCFSSEKENDPQRLMDEQVPPFTSWKLIRRGGQGEVFEVRIHPNQHGFKGTKVFAIKRIEEFRRKRPTNPKREHAILNKFKNNRHDHMISILTAYIQNGVYHLIFPRAHGDLLEYWKSVNPKPSEVESDDNLSWLSTQCQGLAEALGSIHRYETNSFKYLLDPDSLQAAEQNLTGESPGRLRLFGRHGDIKPENILYYPRQEGDLRGRLVIADFGCAAFSTKEEVDRHKRQRIPNTSAYRAPETALSLDDSSISPSYDIWTLGCVYLEFLIWWSGGWAFVKQFTDERLAQDPSFYHMSKEYNLRTDFFFTVTEENGKRTAEVRESVNRFMDKLASHNKANELSSEFLKLIRTKMLVVETLNGKGTKNGRASAMNIASNPPYPLQRRNLSAQRDNMEGITYQPRTAATRATFDSIITIVANGLGDVPHEVMCITADAVLDYLKDDNMKGLDKKQEVDDILGVILSPKQWNKLMALGKKIIDYDDQDDDENNSTA
ncbi:uncharacterized protein FIESC28_00269 [Fusarium coffeatum]|uniref:Protein kinase domain-containing protein n=1 Tax=Fusarium coffeatum TaxID=231269 RepID=A0A366SCE9_9HYPO|nr:uncharacterized protein FIESC28_00269 [Fusarium coffeatum]RBR27001.1 hypothetical protein FIESC28_00269 [Fusarium coffeatum]